MSDPLAQLLEQGQDEANPFLSSSGPGPGAPNPPSAGQAQPGGGGDEDEEEADSEIGEALSPQASPAVPQGAGAAEETAGGVPAFLATPIDDSGEEHTSAAIRASVPSAVRVAGHIASNPALQQRLSGAGAVLNEAAEMSARQGKLPEFLNTDAGHKYLAQANGALDDVNEALRSDMAKQIGYDPHTADIALSQEWQQKQLRLWSIPSEILTGAVSPEKGAAEVALLNAEMATLTPRQHAALQEMTKGILPVLNPLMQNHVMAAQALEQRRHNLAQEGPERILAGAQAHHLEVEDNIAPQTLAIALRKQTLDEKRFNLLEFPTEQAKIAEVRASIDISRINADVLGENAQTGRMSAQQKDLKDQMDSLSLCGQHMRSEYDRLQKTYTAKTTTNVLADPDWQPGGKSYNRMKQLETDLSTITANQLKLTEDMQNAEVSGIDPTTHKPIPGIFLTDAQLVMRHFAPTGGVPTAGDLSTAGHLAPAARAKIFPYNLPVFKPDGTVDASAPSIPAKNRIPQAYLERVEDMLAQHSKAGTLRNPEVAALFTNRNTWIAACKERPGSVANPEASFEHARRLYQYVLSLDGVSRSPVPPAPPPRYPGHTSPTANYAPNPPGKAAKKEKKRQ